MGGSNGAFEPGTLQVAQPYFISGRSGLLTGVAGGGPIARLTQLGMLDPRLSQALQPTPIRVSQIRVIVAPQAAVPAAGFLFEVFKGTGVTPASAGAGALAHAAQRRKTTGYPPIALTETHLFVGGTAAISGGTFTAPDDLAPIDWVAVGIGDTGSGKLIWSPSDSCGEVLEAGEGLEVRAATAMGAAVAIVGVAFDFLR